MLTPRGAQKASQVIFDETTRSYLESEAISTGHLVRIPPAPLVTRNELLRELARGKRCLHVGFADHAHIVNEKRQRGTYLHDILKQSAKSLVGVDSNVTAVENMKRLGLSDVYSSQSLPADLEFDLVCAADVIEHVSNVGSFLEGLRNFSTREYVLTTPNALRLSNRVRLNGEYINTDHRYWFSPYTLCKSAVDAGFVVKKIWYTDTPLWHQPARNFFKRRFPACRDGLCILLEAAPGPT